MKKLIRLTEQDLHKIVKESVKRALNEIGYEDLGISPEEQYEDEEEFNRAMGFGKRRRANVDFRLENT